MVTSPPMIILKAVPSQAIATWHRWQESAQVTLSNGIKDGSGSCSCMVPGVCFVLVNDYSMDTVMPFRANVFCSLLCKLKAGPQGCIQFSKDYSNWKQQCNLPSIPCKVQSIHNLTQQHELRKMRFCYSMYLRSICKRISKLLIT